MSAAVVHYVKHWDNETKGYIEFSDVKNLAGAIDRAGVQLADEILEEAVNGESHLTDKSFSELVTITKAELVDSVQAYAGHRASF